MKSKAFTLIELLVVVLIIGILAAIAVPQYKLAVDKTRITRILPLIKNIDMAQEVYYLTNDRHSQDFSELDIKLPASAISESPKKVVYDDVYYTLYQEEEPHHSVSCYDRKGRLPRIEKYYDLDFIHCWHEGNEYRKKLCASFPNSNCGARSCHINEKYID